MPPDVTEDARARVALASLAEPGDAQLGAAVSRAGAASVLAGIARRRVGLAGGLTDDRIRHFHARRPLLDVDEQLGRAARCGAELLTPERPGWPEGLAELGAEQPLLLWVAGRAGPDILAARSVAVVGARACTAYGEYVAGELSAGLTDRGWTVVSGGAFGIDVAAHRGALAVDGPTVAVLACGVDRAYPQAHTAVLDRIRRTGAVVSELPLGAHPTRARFLTRNRLIAALTRGTVVVEAAARSGATNTAGWADKLSRPVMAVPGPVTSAMSVGCHRLVREEGASLVTCAADVVDLVGDLGTDAVPAVRGELRPEDHLDPLTLRVLESLPVRRWAVPDQISVVAGVDGPGVLRGLALLGAAGLAESADGRWRRARLG